ncbi:MAG TPA: class I SAM-dependent methyltransferase [Candidatus Dormibacteraeota bacterium]|nr:class I SAM-dependent methyltransferase [Candidatus Dormibacteraeota bacterium]
MRERIDLSDRVRRTLLVTLYSRAIDYRSPAPLLGDRWADEALRRIGRVGPLVRVAGLDAYVAVLRARLMDAWAREFLAEHEDAVVLHLACGLDSRVLRLDPGPGVRWYDLDFPDVVEIRRRLLPRRDGCQLIASSVTEPDWIRQIPNDAPVLIIAEGLLPYLSEADARSLLERLTEHFGEGDLVLDVMSSPMARLSGLLGYTLWGLDDPREIERWCPRLRLIDDADVLAARARIPLAGLRLYTRAMSWIPAYRRMIRPLRFRLSKGLVRRGR